MPTQNTILDETDPTTWGDPGFHKDWGDTASWMRSLRECCVEILNAVPNSSVRVNAFPDEGLLCCTIFVAEKAMGELYWVRSTRKGITYDFAFFSDEGSDLELYTPLVGDVCRIVKQVSEGIDLEDLAKEFDPDGEREDLNHE